MYNEFWGKIAAVLIFVGFNMTFFTQFILGAKGMPRRYYNYVEEFQALHQFSTVGSWVLGLGFIVIAVYLVHSLAKGRTAPKNPWGGRTLEWMASSPPEKHNFTYTPIVTHGPYDFHKPLAEFQLGLVGSGHSNGHETNGHSATNGQSATTGSESEAKA